MAAVGTVAAGVTVADVAGRRAVTSIVIASGLASVGLREIMRSVETTGAEGVELPIVLAVVAVFGGLLSLGVVLHRRRTAARHTS